MQDDLRKRANNAAGAVFFIGGLSAAAGLIAVLFNVGFLKNMGIGFWSIVEGALFLYLGRLVKNGSVTSLWIAIVLYGIEVCFSVVLMIRMKQPAATGSLLIRGWLLYSMFQGVGAVGQIESDAAPPVHPVPPPAPPPRAPAPRLTGEAERRRIEMSTLTRSKIDKPAPMIGELRRFDVGGKDAVSAAASSLRFVAYRCEIGPRGLKASYSDGSVREIDWMNMASLVIRQLPPDKPWEGKVVLDILPMAAPGFMAPPVRIFASTYVNYAALPGGQATSTQENIRRLAAHIDTQTRP